MNAITQALLAGAALGALTTAPAIAADSPHFGVVALHAGHMVNKTRIRSPGRQHITTVLSTSSYIPASDLRIKTKLSNTFLFLGSSNSCWTNSTQPKEKIEVPKKSTYGKTGPATETKSQGCLWGPTVFYGDTYKLTDTAGEGKTDRFLSTLIGKFQRKGLKYKFTVYLYVNVSIGE